MNVIKFKSLLNKQLFNTASRLAARSVSSSPLASGISFQISEEQNSFLELAEKFSREEIIPNAAHHDSKFYFV